MVSPEGNLQENSLPPLGQEKSLPNSLWGIVGGGSVLDSHGSLLLLSRATACECLESSYFKEKPLRKSLLWLLPQASPSSSPAVA